MGRSDRRAPSRICSTALELRTQQVSSSMVALTLVLPSSTVVSLSSKPPASVSSPSSPPPSPDTPDQTPPACVKPSLQAWPQGVLQLMQQQVEALSSSRRNCGSNNEEQPGKRKRESEQEEKSLGMKRCEEKAAAAAAVEVELHAQSPLPEDWEQFLNLKVSLDSRFCMRFMFTALQSSVAQRSTNFHSSRAFLIARLLFVCLSVCRRRVSFTISTGFHASEQRVIPESCCGKRMNPCKLWSSKLRFVASHSRRTTRKLTSFLLLLPHQKTS